MAIDPDDPMRVDFSGEKKTAESLKKKGAYTEYANIDLASGYPKNMIWTTKDGRRIAVPNMSDDHLLNTIAFIRRRVQNYKKQVAIRFLMNATAAGMLFDDIRQDTIDALSAEAMRKIRELEKLSDDEFLLKIFPIYGKMYQEAYRRKILIEVDSSKISYNPCAEQNILRPQPKVTQASEGIHPRIGEKPIRKVKKPPTDDEIIDSYLQSAKDTDGIEVHESSWKWAEKAVKKYPTQLSLGPARGPSSAWKRLYYNGDDNE